MCIGSGHLLGAAVVFLHLSVVGHSTGGSSAGELAIPSHWKVGDGWRFDVEWFPAKKETPAKFKMSASVAKGTSVADKDCWLVVMGGDGELPDESDFVLHLSIDKKTGWPLKAVEYEGEFKGKFIPLAGRSIIAPPLQLFPAEFFAIIEPGEFTFGPHKIVATRHKAGSITEVGLTFFEANVEQWRVRQTWNDGELFWHTYERHVMGRLALKATCTHADLAKRTDAERSEFGGKKPLAELLAEKERQFREAHPLRQDKRLHAMVQVEPKRPSVDHVLARIKGATGIDVQVASDLKNHVPDLGYISPSKNGYFAWQLMEHLAAIEIQDARWEKTPAGYRLTGISKVPLGRVLPKYSDAPTEKAPVQPTLTPTVEPAKDEEGPSPWRMVGAVALFALAVGIGVFLVVRWRKNAAAGPI